MRVIEHMAHTEKDADAGGVFQENSTHSERSGMKGPDGVESIPTPLEVEIIAVAKRMMARHYVLDVDALYTECVRTLKDHDRSNIDREIDNLVRRKVLVNGKAIIRDHLLENQARAAIFQLIKEEPGINFSSIKERTRFDSRTVQWHVKMLEKFDFIRVASFGNNVIYFDFFFDRTHDVVYYYLQKDGVIDIVRVVIHNQAVPFTALLNALGMPRSTLMRRIKTLIEEGILEGKIEANQLVNIRITPTALPLLKENAIKNGWIQA
jgi:DNA-binding transcriptional ArsR family regulator